MNKFNIYLNNIINKIFKIVPVFGSCQKIPLMVPILFYSYSLTLPHNFFLMIIYVFVFLYSSQMHIFHSIPPLEIPPHIHPVHVLLRMLKYANILVHIFSVLTGYPYTPYSMLAYYRITELILGILLCFSLFEKYNELPDYRKNILNYTSSLGNPYFA